MVSYVTHKNRSVILLSSTHHDAKIDERTKKKQKPEIITYYNRTKCGVDVLDQMCEMYNTARTSRKWPWVHMFNLINISAINARVIYRQVNPKEIKKSEEGKPATSRIEFLDELGYQLMLPALKRRACNNRLDYETRELAAEIAGIDLSTFVRSQGPQPPPLGSDDQLTRSKSKKKTKAAREEPESSYCFTCRKSGLKKQVRRTCDMEGCLNRFCEQHANKLCEQCFDNINN